MFKCIGESGRIVALAVVGDIFPNTIDKVADVLTVFVPARAFLLALLVTVDRNFHTVVEQSVGFGIVENVEAHFIASTSVADLEEEPLSMALRIDII